MNGKNCDSVGEERHVRKDDFALVRQSLSAVLSVPMDIGLSHFKAAEPVQAGRERTPGDECPGHLPKEIYLIWRF